MPQKKNQSFIQKITEWYTNTPTRYKEIVVAISSLVIAFLLSLAMLDQAGTVGHIIRERLFESESVDGVAVFGLGLPIIILALVAFAMLLFLNYERLSKRRFLSGATVFFLSISALLSGNIEDSAGVVGNYLFTILYTLSGFFAYVILVAGVLFSLFLLKFFSPVAIWSWLTQHKGEDEDDLDDDAEDEYEDEEMFNDEEEEEEYEMTDEEEEEEFEEEEEEEIEQKPAPRARKNAKYKAPPLSLLGSQKGSGKTGNTREQARAVVRTLQNFNVEVTVEDVVVGPTFTRYAIRPAEGVRLQKITALQQNIELALAAHPIRIEAPIPGESLVGIEIPNTTRATLGLKDLLQARQFKSVQGGLPLVIGKTITGEVFVKNLAKMPHMLVAGTTGSGKSVIIHNFILSLLFTYGPQDLRFIFIDPKRVELTLYKGIAHLYTDPITVPKKALQALVWVVNEMERRYQELEDAGARDIDSYNTTAQKQAREHMPYLVVVIDELADLMQSFPREIEANIVRIAQKSRAVGIHLILSTQRPSVNIITGVVKANIPVRVALQVASNVDSRTILDTTGAENLIGNGDLLFVSAETKKPVRAQSAFVSEDEVKKVAEYIKKHNGLPEGIINVEQAAPAATSGGSSGDDGDDELYEEAREVVISAKKASTSLLQRKLKIGYSRAARLIDMLEEQGVVGPQVGSKPREILQEE